MTLKPVAWLLPCEYRGMQRLKAPYNKGIIELLGTFKPWARWERATKEWIVPDYAARKLREAFEQRGFEVRGEGSLPHSDIAHDEGLHEYQLKDVRAALRDGYRFLAYSMGVGKTAVAVTAMRNWRKTRLRCLVVCPASVREVWQSEIAKWWPDAPEVTLISKGTDEIPTEGIVVTSYELLEAIQEAGGLWDVIITDESHYIKNRRTQRSKSLVELSSHSPRALRLALTGTPISDRPVDLHSQLDWLTPNRWLSWWRFINLFCHVEKHDYGHKIYGAKHQEVLRAQLATVGSRITWDEVKDFKPDVMPPQVRQVTCKARAVSELVEGGDEPLLVFTWLRKDARAMHRHLESAHKDRKVFCVTGEIPPTKRAQVLRCAVDTPGSILVATMDSVGTGIDLLSFYSVVVFAGLSYKLQTLVQAIGRVYRLSQKNKVRLYFFTTRGGLESQIAYSVTAKLATNTSIIDGGIAEDQLVEMLRPPDVSTEDFQTALTKQLEVTYDTNDEYL